MVVTSSRSSPSVRPGPIPTCSPGTALTQSAGSSSSRGFQSLLGAPCIHGSLMIPSNMPLTGVQGQELIKQVFTLYEHQEKQVVYSAQYLLTQPSESLPLKGRDRVATEGP